MLLKILEIYTMRVNRTLLDDIKQLYFSIDCITEDNTFCHYCGNCQNKDLCKTIERLISSLRKFY